MATANTKRSENKDSADLYSTPKIALDAIKDLLIEDINNVKKDEVDILEPCAGIGAISEWLIDAMEDYNHDNPKTVLVHDNELHNYGYGTTHQEDFLGADINLGEYDLIVTNPPYNRAMQFIFKGFEHAPVQWHLLRLSFLEGQERYKELFNMGFLSDVYIFSYRISCPKGVNMEDSPNSVSYAWYRFDVKYCGAPRLHWLHK